MFADVIALIAKIAGNDALVHDMGRSRAWKVPGMTSGRRRRR